MEAARAKDHAGRDQLAVERAVALGAAGVLLAVTLALAALTLRNFQESRVQTAKETIRATREAIVDRLRFYEYGLYGLRGALLAAGAEKAPAAELERFARARPFDRQFAGALGFGIIRRVPAESERSYVAAQRAAGAPEFAIRQLSPQGGERYVIENIWPAEPNSPAIGLDIASEAARRDAAKAAMDSGEPRLTRPITLVQRTQEQRRGFLLLVPMPRATSKPAPFVGGAENIWGWVYAPLVIDDVLAGIETVGDVLSITLTDITGDGPKDLFYHVTRPHGAEQTLIEQRYQIDFAGRHWQADFQFSGQVAGTQPRQAAGAILVVGIILSGLVGASLFMALRQRRRNERAESYQQLKSLFDNAFIGILSADEKLNIVEVNREAAGIFGYEEAELLGRPLNLLVPRRVHSVHHQHIAAFAAGPVDHQAMSDWRRVTGVTADGREIPLMVVISRSRRANQNYYTAFLRDMSEVRDQEKRLSDLAVRLSGELDTAQAASEAKSKFLAVMSHELRTPLNAIIGFSESMDKEIFGPMANVRYRDYAGHILSSGQHLLALINDVLDLSRIEARKLELFPEKVSFGETAQRAVTLLGPSIAAKGLDGGRSPRASSDSDQSFVQRREVYGKGRYPD